jgi:probable F420-dependent oxidoreductase
MRLGFALPQIGAVAGPEAIAAIAQRAEAIGYDSLWVLDRLLWPVNPQARYPLGDGSLPEQYKRTLDPVETLTFAAALTRKIALGTSVVNIPWYNPVLLARTLTSLDVLSAGRLRVGLGIGWSPDEYVATGSVWDERGKRTDESIQALKAIWTTDPVEFQGNYYRIPKSFISLKPVQKPHPPIYMAAFTPAAMQRVAREANGWFPVGIPIAAIPQMLDGIRQMAREAGRKEDEIELFVRGQVELSDQAVRNGRGDFTGSLEQIAGDIAATKSMGAVELVFDVQFSAEIKGTNDILTQLEQLRRAAVG